MIWSNRDAVLFWQRSESQKVRRQSNILRQCGGIGREGAEFEAKVLAQTNYGANSHIFAIREGRGLMRYGGGHCCTWADAWAKVSNFGEYESSQLICDWPESDRYCNTSVVSSHV